MNDNVKESRKAGRKFLFILIAFFMVFATVDAYFVYKAVSTNTGVVVEHAYEVGLNYNDLLEQARQNDNAAQQ